MKHYVGERTPEGCQVDVIDKEAPGGGYPWPPRFDLRNHSPTGYEWGYAGSGLAQLALTLLADALGDDEKAQDHYQNFKFKVVGRLPHDRWELSQEGHRANRRPAGSGTRQGTQVTGIFPAPTSPIPSKETPAAALPPAAGPWSPCPDVDKRPR